MANVHSLSDLGPSSPSSSSSSPRDLKYLEFILPGFTARSVVLAVSLLDILLYFISCAIPPASGPLSPSSDVLREFSAYGPDMRRGQVWRVFTPLLLHLSIWHLLMNVYAQLIMGFGSERSGVFGNLFSSATTYCSSGVGASVSGFGLFGVELAQVVVTWHLISDRPRVVFRLAMFCFMMLIMSMQLNIDHMGHLGGCIGGFLIGILYETNMENKPSWYDKAKWMTIIALPSITVLSCLGTFVIPRDCLVPKK
eukprot:GHVS01096822.1.p1 GENE.GHVS01096822.1~~GHVS01096822.1.p1  ORF type:complete len:253 (-),score=26.57 GHVS01096822.1:176-934(-)